MEPEIPEFGLNYTIFAPLVTASIQSGMLPIMGGALAIWIGMKSWRWLLFMLGDWASIEYDGQSLRDWERGLRADAAHKEYQTAFRENGFGENAHTRKLRAKWRATKNGWTIPEAPKRRRRRRRAEW